MRTESLKLLDELVEIVNEEVRLSQRKKAIIKKLIASEKEPAPAFCKDWKL